MTLFFHELKKNLIKLIVWTAVISFMLCVSIAIYPQMAEQMNDIGGMFSEMGEFSAAFNMDKINFGEFKGYFAVECGNVLGLGGAFFAALAGITALACEEKERTAEFLLTHPVSRAYVVTQKLAAVIAQILILNAVAALASAAVILAAGEKIGAGLFLTVFSGFLLMQIEIACIMFGVSAFIRGGGLGAGLGAAFALYFMNIIANLTEKAEFLRYITPFSYADGASIVQSGRIEIKYLIPGLLFTAAGIAAAYVKYGKKDINS